MMRSLISLPLFAAAALSYPTASNDRFDYVIVGGGTSGLVVANRLSELKNVTVAVIEAGGSVYDNANVTDLGGYGKAFDTSIDYAYETVGQKYGGNKTQTLRAGKALGGTSTINGMAYTRAQSAQVDIWEKLGNDGWNWDNLLEYYKKSETLERPTAEQAAHGATFIPEQHGTSGPLKVGWKPNMVEHSFVDVLNQTYSSVGVPALQDIAGGDMVGWNIYPATVDTTLQVREDAARAYYFPYQNRTNIRVFLYTEAQKLVWSNSSSTADATASGVLVKDATGAVRTIHANKEVILSAGSLRSPLLLEQSGVGNPSILKAAGIDPKVVLPTVGENLQDQMNNGLAQTSTKNFTGATTFVAYPNVDDVFADRTAALAADVKRKLPRWARQTSERTNGAVTTRQLAAFFDMQYDLIFTSKVPLAEILVTPAAGAFSTEYWALLPFARGNIHVRRAGSSAARIDPNYFMMDWDMTEQVGTAKFIRRLYDTAPLSEYFAGETKPGLDVVAEDAEDDVWSRWITENYRSNFHPVGTTAMMSRELGGVVDANLKVYGTSNVRVVDAGILPFQVCGHLVSTLYAVAEKASDIIKASA
ncbi:Glucose oxidase [Colletotrichum orbiculare MAFF 240422]|uniref:Glucose oxidase n=1 Tax=Colletotrichum orbiculare (strain 104-T / ATCC 96160 / CBS 514.97 / LARS 414 / MAFF 240422) TaxID=1213857 RepID=N4VGS5_COLOR|nr:Glucose oxidase [Colletotrichum orbiculare MAFF 240422]